MIKTSTQNNKELYQCEVCGFHYERKEWAEQCEAWCKEHNSCNLEITGNAEENKKVEETKTELVFVYNADSTLFAVASDFVKKIVAPNAQECNLCKITYGALSPNEEWSSFLATLPQEKVFLHRDEFRSLYPDKKGIALPAIFIRQDGTLATLVTADKINNTKTIGDLVALVTNALSKLKSSIIWI